ncbi:MAG: hypothetical protein ACKVPX_08410 [Myxococcaceae bacterium]
MSGDKRVGRANGANKAGGHETAVNSPEAAASAAPTPPLAAPDPTTPVTPRPIEAAVADALSRHEFIGIDRQNNPEMVKDWAAFLRAQEFLKGESTGDQGVFDAAMEQATFAFQKKTLELNPGSGFRLDGFVGQQTLAASYGMVGDGFPPTTAEFADRQFIAKPGTSKATAAELAAQRAEFKKLATASGQSGFSNDKPAGGGPRLDGAPTGTPPAPKADAPPAGNVAKVLAEQAHLEKAQARVETNDKWMLGVAGRVLTRVPLTKENEEFLKKANDETRNGARLALASVVREGYLEDLKAQGKSYATYAMTQEDADKLVQDASQSETDVNAILGRFRRAQKSAAAAEGAGGESGTAAKTAASEAPAKPASGPLAKTPREEQVEGLLRQKIGQELSELVAKDPDYKDLNTSQQQAIADAALRDAFGTYQAMKLHKKDDNQFAALMSGLKDQSVGNWLDMAKRELAEKK